MKKTSIILAMAALALGFTSCKQEDEPQYHNPTTFTIATPALQNQVFETSTEMTDNATFNLFCTQPDYGYSAICKYSAICSLDPECPVENGEPVDGKSIALENLNSSSAAMSIKTFELGAAACKLAGIYTEDEFEQSAYATQPTKIYFRAVCEIPDIEGSRIVSSNVVSYNYVQLRFAIKKAGWIYICGDVSNLTTGVSNGFLAPSSANLGTYNDNFQLVEPQDKIGEKVYVGVFGLDPKENDPDKSYEDNCSQFRFFTELLGWSTAASIGSNEADFYCMSITDKWEAGFEGSMVWQGLGNWGVWLCDKTGPQAVTIVVDLSQGNDKAKLYVKEGEHTVTFTGTTPSFE